MDILKLLLTYKLFKIMSGKLSKSNNFRLKIPCIYFVI